MKLFKHLTFFFVIIFFPSMANAKWEIYAFHEINGGAVIMYYDPSTINKINGVVKVWTLTDYAVQQKSDNKYYLSDISLEGLNCFNETQGVFQITRYSKSGGKGEVIESVSLSEDQIKWHFIVPASLGMELYKAVCRAR